MIRGLFGRSEELLSEYRRAGSELGVFTLTLVGVEDPFDPDPFWDRRYGGSANIVERVSGDKEFRLQSALDGCRNSKFVRDEAGRFREKNPVFTDVVMWIPGGVCKAEARRGGHRLEALARNLGHLHQTKFAKSLPGDRVPIYTIMPDDDLEDGTAVFQFGFGVFVPGGDDVQRARLSLRLPESDTPLDFPDWSFWREGAQIKRPVAVYQGQDSVLIAPNADGPIRAPVWFKERQGHILLNLNAADSERVYADDDGIQLVETKELEGGAVEWFLESRPEKGGRTRKADKDLLVVRLTPMAKPVKLRDTKAEQAVPTRARTRMVDWPKAKSEAKKSAKEKKSKTPSKGRKMFAIERLLASTQDEDAAETASTPISSRYALRLAGLGLLRIDGERRLDGLRDWVIWFDDNGWPLQEDASAAVDTNRCLALSANATDGVLNYRLAGETDLKPVQQIPCVLPTASGEHLELIASPLPDRYHGILFLKQEISFPLSPKPLVLGRSNLNPSGLQPDLPLELLTHPNSLHWWDEGGYPGAKLNAINLSRRHVTVQLKEGRLDMYMAEGTAGVYVLDAQAKYARKLEPGSKQHQELEPGQMMLVGSYLLRFHREKTRTIASNETTVLRPSRQL